MEKISDNRKKELKDPKEERRVAEVREEKENSSRPRKDETLLNWLKPANPSQKKDKKKMILTLYLVKFFAEKMRGRPSSGICTFSRKDLFDITLIATGGFLYD
jgi:hypothetical protein